MVLRMFKSPKIFSETPETKNILSVVISIKNLSYILLIYSGRISISIPKELEKSKPKPKQEWNAAQQTPNPVASCPASRVCGDNRWAPTDLASTTPIVLSTTIHMNSLQGLWTVRHFLVSLAFSWKLSTSLHDTVTLAFRLPVKLGTMASSTCIQDPFYFNCTGSLNVYSDTLGKNSKLPSKH